MSKAFTKETDTEEDDADPSTPALPAGTKNYITPRGHAKLKSELHELLSRERPKLVETIAWAASNGDRSENGDYIYGKRRLREIDRRIRFLTRRLEAAEVVEPDGKPRDRVLFGARVTVKDETGKERAIEIVGIDESDPANGRVSWISPVAKALMNAKLGDEVTLRKPGGDEILEVMRIE